ncbi:glycosyltransferase family 4 protein [Bosea sp. NBC_00550]|uniref:glycosyltransferase family 4 protein n=1 Tax=Bosea sp. NBC_00550 TaxID=2969621 RepID=UPI00222F0734|nr:glycosyltransferase family 4 protein [Bosea sp. NBC_00550]UZF94395.1 glycosyltransferase family 4 protein [Bosea sp. NBC_00550]
MFGRYQKVGSALNAALLARRYDRLYVTAEGVGLPLAILLKLSGWKGKMACVFHNSGWKSKKLVLSLLGHDIFAALITVNELQAKILTDDCGMPQDKVMAAFNWVDDRFFRPADEDTDSIAAPFVMACGAENRDYDTLARAAGRVEGKFAVYGHGYRADNVRARDCPPNMEYMSRVSFPELRNAYARSSIVVVPLNDVDYAAGVTGIVEAMAAGRPIVATASRGIREYLTGFDPWTVVQPGDDEAMAAALTRLNGDRELRERLGRQNRIFAEERCSLDGYVNQVAERLARHDPRGVQPFTRCLRPNSPTSEVRR